MDAWEWIVIVAAAAVVIVVIAAALSMRRRRVQSAHLRDTFGPEYERVAMSDDGRPNREGEAELRRRELRRSHLEIRQLSPEQQERYLTEWTQIQSTFVDTPDRSVASAEMLVDQVMRAR